VAQGLASPTAGPLPGQPRRPRLGRPDTTPRRPPTRPPRGPPTPPPRGRPTPPPRGPRTRPLRARRHHVLAARRKARLGPPTGPRSHRQHGLDRTAERVHIATANRPTRAVATTPSWPPIYSSRAHPAWPARPFRSRPACTDLRKSRLIRNPQIARKSCANAGHGAVRTQEVGIASQVFRSFRRQGWQLLVQEHRRSSTVRTVE
jgi:hypothetical protein